MLWLYWRYYPERINELERAAKEQTRNVGAPKGGSEGELLNKDDEDL